MPPWLYVIALSLPAGAAIPVGGLIARIERFRRRWLEQELRHTVIAFGGGALLSAVALVLVPEGIRHVSAWTASIAFACGGLAFMGLDVLLAKRGTSASQLVAMLADFVPEAVALGASLAMGSQSALLLAILIGMQNLPEGFNAYRELVGQLKPRRVILVFCVFALFGPVAGLLGFFFLAGFPTLVAILMLSSAGGILYLIFQDIAPQASLKRHWSPPLGAVAGFLLGLIGHMLVHG